jgi:hypothetical protein
MEKSCPDHGRTIDLLCPDPETYLRLREAPRLPQTPSSYRSPVREGCPSDCGLCPGHEQHTCLAILEVTDRCDLGCPFCIAASTRKGRDISLAQARSALEALIESQGSPVALQLSGGEPTLHPRLVEIVSLASSLGFSRLEIDTNGLSLAGETDLPGRLRDAGLRGVYLQMDGPTPEAHLRIRGRNLLEEKISAVEACLKAGLQVVLAVTVVGGLNDHLLWDMVLFGVERGLTGVSFQAVALSGRVPRRLERRTSRFTLGHFIHAMEAQSRGRIRSSDIIPIPCPDTRCAAVSYLLVDRGEVVPLTRILGVEELLPLAAGLSDWEEVIRRFNGPCSGTGCCPQAQIVLPLEGTDFFCIAFHGMMDPWNIDLERTRRCCVHALTPRGRLTPFCLHRIRRTLRAPSE